MLGREASVNAQFPGEAHTLLKQGIALFIVPQPFHLRLTSEAPDLWRVPLRTHGEPPLCSRRGSQPYPLGWDTDPLARRVDCGGGRSIKGTVLV